MQTTTAAHKKSLPTLAQFSENWIWRALYCLIESPSFDPSPRWIASKLDITVEKALDALEGLQDLGLIKREGNSYQLIANENAYHHVNSEDLTLEHLLINHIKIAPQVLSKLEAQDAFTTQFFLGNRELIKKYSPKFIALYKEIEREARALKINEVIASEISFVQVTKNEGGK